MQRAWKAKQDRASMRFGTIAATIYNAVQAFGSKSANRKAYRWTDIFAPITRTLETPTDDGPQTYEELKAYWRAHPEAARKQAATAKETGSGMLERFAKAGVRA